MDFLYGELIFSSFTETKKAIVLRNPITDVDIWLPKQEWIDIMNLLSERVHKGDYKIEEIHEYNQYKLKITLSMDVE